MYRRQFIENLGYQLGMSHIKKCLQSQSFQKYVLTDAINSVTAYLSNKNDSMANGSVVNSQDISAKPAMGHLCIVGLRGVPGKERLRLK